ncbi:MAG: dephospho-CoA kinase [Candidatus Omnitrophica bacterium]|nr:dephospho-CoA kinase [Candidatus Omnitrophota bacterium]
MIVIGLTGGLASGKTTIAKIFKRYSGVVVLNADTVAHRALYKDSPLFKKIIGAFGKGILSADGAISRKKLAESVFKNKKKYQKLCALIYPWLLDQVERKIALYRNKKKIKAVVVEAAMLIESGLYHQMDIIVVVHLSKTQQLARAIKRGRMSLEQIKKRIKFQMSQEGKNKYADCIIKNNGNLQEAKRQVKEFFKQHNI